MTNRGSFLTASPPSFTSTSTGGVFKLNDAAILRAANQYPRGPSAPTSLSATAGNAQLALSWTAPSTTHGTITNYLVEYTASGGSAQYVLTGSTSTSYTLTGLTNGTSYSVRVAAVNFTAGDYSGTASGTPVATTDPLYANVSLLLNFDGTNGQKTYADQSSNARTLTSSFHSLTTAQKKFGTASLQLDGTGAINTYDLTFPAGTFPSGTESFCVEFWFYGTQFAIQNYSTLNYDAFVSMNSTWQNNFLPGAASNYGTWTNLGYSSAWQHIALVRDGNSYRIYVNGTQSSSGTMTASFPNESLSIYRHRDGDPSIRSDGFLDSLRVTRGHPRYTSNFTPPAFAFAP